jgi:glyceraldehyde 3-phosphate dehydrogenase
VPTSTGAAKAIGLVMLELAGKLDGLAMRVPIPDGSIVDLVVELDSDVTVESINAAMQAAALGPMEGILQYSVDEIVSSDIIGNSHSSIFDSLLTQVMQDRMVKVVSWYDNEWGYSTRVEELVQRLAKMDGIV